MKPHPISSRIDRFHVTRGFTLLEMSMVICVLMVLLGTSLYVGGAIREWRAGRQASEALREVYSAQRMFLADNPSTPVANIIADQLIQYLPSRADEMPTVKPLKGAALGFRVNVSPPVLIQGGAVYDPSGQPNDNLWDVGE